MRAVVQPDTCQGCGMCEGAAPEVFRVDPTGHVAVLLDELPDELIEAAEDAVESCPSEAISLAP